MPWRRHSTILDRRHVERADEAPRRRSSDEREAEQQRRIDDTREFLAEQRERMKNALGS